MTEEKIDKAKRLLDEWIAEEKNIDQQRAEVIGDLQKKIAEIQRARTLVRAKIKETIKLFDTWKSTAG